MISYWEREFYYDECDIAIIGGGYVGLSAAIHLKTKLPNKRIHIYEKGVMPSGASTKNAGFACFGSLSEILTDLDNMSENEVYNLVEERFSGLKTIAQMFGEASIDLQFNGGFEIFRKEDKELHSTCMKKIESVNTLLAPIFNKRVFRSIHKSESGFGFKGVSHIIYNQFEGELNPVKLLKSLQQKAKDLGVQSHFGTYIEKLEKNGQHCELVLENTIKIRSKQVVIATNGFASQFLDLNIDPARAQVLITKPIKDLKIKGCFHLDRGYYYFRNVVGRLLLGGGRELDISGETTTKIEITKIIQSQLEKIIREYILPGKKFEIEQKWSGIMGVGKSKYPIIKQIEENVFCSVRLGGMGVAIGVNTGIKVAELLISNTQQD